MRYNDIYKLPTIKAMKAGAKATEKTLAGQLRSSLLRMGINVGRYTNLASLIKALNLGSSNPIDTQKAI